MINIVKAIKSDNCFTLVSKKFKSIIEIIQETVASKEYTIKYNFFCFW